MPVPMRPKIYTPPKKQSKVIKLLDPVDTSRSVHQNAMPLSKIIDVEKVIKKDKEVKESDVFDLPKKPKKAKKAK
tara:strand:- start:266 stop:490 length:225 start_codon:yes stop_codon:yes gene_type:complete